MIKVGRVCMKIAGRDSGKIGVVVEVVDDNYVVIDGQVRRKKCNINHLEPLDEVLKIKAKASSGDVVKALKDIGIIVEPKKGKTRKERIRKVRKSKKEVKKDSSKKPKPKKK